MEYSGTLSAKGKQFAVVVASFNSLITEKLLAGAKQCIEQHEGNTPDIFWVPGSMELAFIANKLSKKNLYHGICCLGAVIKGDTDHYDYVASNTASSIAAIARESSIPISFGVLTTHTVEQALNRAGIKHGNAGYSAALAIIDQASLSQQIDEIKK